MAVFVSACLCILPYHCILLLLVLARPLLSTLRAPGAFLACGPLHRLAQHDIGRYVFDPAQSLRSGAFEPKP